MNRRPSEKDAPPVRLARPVPSNPVVRWRRRFLGMMRLTAYVFCASLLCAALGARVVYSDVKEGSLQLGRELDSLDDLLGTTKTVFINGTAMNVSNATIEASPKDVLDRFETLCRAHPEFLARAFADIPETLRDQVIAPKEAAHFGVMRAEANGDGAITCFMDDRPAGAKDLAARLKAFSDSWDLSEFGRFRYVYAGAMSGVNAGKTRVRTVWADGAFNLKAMFPAKGDAAGFDSPVIPRPPGSRRILSATAAQVPFGVHIYDSPESKALLRAFYDEQMAALGWRRVPNGGEQGSDPNEPDSIGYIADVGHAVYVSLRSKRGSTLVTTTETARPGDPSEAVVELHN
jgi:hypothetical protein